MYWEHLAKVYLSFFFFFFKPRNAIWFGNKANISLALANRELNRTAELSEHITACFQGFLWSYNPGSRQAMTSWTGLVPVGGLGKLCESSQPLTEICVCVSAMADCFY